MIRVYVALAGCALFLKAADMYELPPLAAEAPPSSRPAVSAGSSPAPSAADLGIEFVKDSTSNLIVERNGRRYLVDLVARTVRETGPAEAARPPIPASGRSSALPALPSDGGKVFASNCATCHGANGKGTRAKRTPNFTDPKVQASLTDEQILTTIRDGRPGTAMPSWRDKLADPDIQAVAAYVRSLGGKKLSATGSGQPPAEARKPKVYEPGDDVLMALPTGRRLDRRGFYVNFAHRFPYDPAFSGTARGGALIGLDGFAVPSFGFRYGFTSKLSGSIYRSPSIIGAPIQLMGAYHFTDEHDGYPLNVTLRLSIEGQNNLRKNYVESIEGIFSRSITSHAQIYLVPTASFNDRHLEQSGFRSQEILDVPGHNTFSLGVGAAVDIRPTVALVAEVIPTLVNGRPLDIHRPAYSFGIQKKIWRHSFTFGFTTSPGTTVSQRAGTRASFLNDPTADKPSGLFVGFDLMRQIY
jgi:mono/diheme cytochrome c family protein